MLAPSVTHFLWLWLHPSTDIPLTKSPVTSMHSNPTGWVSSLTAANSQQPQLKPSTFCLAGSLLGSWNNTSAGFASCFSDFPFSAFSSSSFSSVHSLKRSFLGAWSLPSLRESHTFVRGTNPDLPLIFSAFFIRSPTYLPGMFNFKVSKTELLCWEIFYYWLNLLTRDWSIQISCFFPILSW